MQKIAKSSLYKCSVEKVFVKFKLFWATPVEVPCYSLGVFLPSLLSFWGTKYWIRTISYVSWMFSIKITAFEKEKCAHHESSPEIHDSLTAETFWLGADTCWLPHQKVLAIKESWISGLTTKANRGNKQHEQEKWKILTLK